MLTAKTLKGRSAYFDENGNQVLTRRERGRGGNRLPDYVFRFLTPQAATKSIQVSSEEAPEQRRERRNRILPEMRRQAATPQKLSVRDRVSNWFKSLFSWLMKKK